MMILLKNWKSILLLCLVFVFNTYAAFNKGNVIFDSPYFVVKNSSQTDTLLVIDSHGDIWFNSISILEQHDIPSSIANSFIISADTDTSFVFNASHALLKGSIFTKLDTIPEDSISGNDLVIRNLDKDIVALFEGTTGNVYTKGDVYPKFTTQSEYKSCMDVLSNHSNAPSGIYLVDPDGIGPIVPTEVYCEMSLAGGGWTLISNRKTGTDNKDDCGTSLNDFIQHDCGSPSAIEASQSYSIGKTFRNALSKNSWLNIQYLDGVLDSDDAFIVNTDSELFPDSDVGVLFTIPLDNICDINGENCDNTDVHWKYSIGGWFGNSWCSEPLSPGTFNGNYGYCADGNLADSSNRKFGDRHGYDETKLWGHPTVISDSYQERIFVKNTYTPYSSCQDIHMQRPNDPDGIYTIDPDGAGPETDLEVYCDMTTDGGGWTLVFNHKMVPEMVTTEDSTFLDFTDAQNRNQNNPTANLYSILNKLDHFKNQKAFTFKINWPQLPHRNIWSQTSNPTTSLIKGYQPIKIDINTYDWGGLELGNNAVNNNGDQALIDGSINSSMWRYAIGSKDVWTNGGLSGMPAYSNTPANHVQLWIKGSHTPLPTSCLDILNTAKIYNLKLPESGFYMIDLDGPGTQTPFHVYCDMDTDGGGWIDLVKTISNSNDAPSQQVIRDLFFETGSDTLRLGDIQAGTDWFYITETPDKYSAAHAAPLFLSKDLFNYSQVKTSWKKQGFDENNWRCLHDNWIPLNGPGFNGGFSTNFMVTCPTDLTCIQGSSQELRDTSISAIYENSTLSPTEVLAWSGSGSRDSLLTEGGCAHDPLMHTLSPATEFTQLLIREGNTLESKTCLEVLQNFPDSKSGEYAIDPDGTGSSPPMKVYCDMETDGGGWTLFYANAADTDMDNEKKKSYITHLSEKAGLDLNSFGFEDKNLAGMIDYTHFSSAVEVMAKDIGNWNTSEFSSISFENHPSLASFLNLTIVPSTIQTDCNTLPNNEIFYVRNSNGVAYSFDQMAGWDPVNQGLGWGSCHPNWGGHINASTDPNNMTSISDVENYPGLYFYRTNGDIDEHRTRGVGGFNSGNLATKARYFIREALEHPRSCQEILNKYPHALDGIHTIDPDGSGGNAPFKVYCDMTTDGGGWTMVWSNLLGGATKAETGMNWDTSINTLPIVRDNVADNLTGTLSNDIETWQVYTGLKYWKLLIDNSPTKQILYNWANEYTSPIDFSYRATIDLNVTNNYQLLLTDGHSIVGDSIPGIYEYHKNLMWTTVDVDNDTSSTNCSQNYSNTPWWYGQCWDGGINGGGANKGGGYPNGAYWKSSKKNPGNELGHGAGNGWIYLR